MLAEYAGWLVEQCRAVALSRAPLAAAVGTSTVELAGTRVGLELAFT